MTIIVAVKWCGDRVCMACDSQATDNGRKITLWEPKVFALDGVLFGNDGYMGLGDIVRHTMPLDLFEHDWPLDKWLAAKFVPWLRKACKEAGLWRESEAPCQLVGSFLVARAGEFYQVARDGAVVSFERGYAAIGSGTSEALGAMSVAIEWVLQEECSDDEEAERVARHGVRAAINLDDGCGGPIRVVWSHPQAIYSEPKRNWHCPVCKNGGVSGTEDLHDERCPGKIQYQPELLGPIYFNQRKRPPGPPDPPRCKECGSHALQPHSQECSRGKRRT